MWHPVMEHCEQTKRQWISGLAIILTALVCLFSFSKLAPDVTLIVALVALVVLVALFWWTGRTKKN